MSAQPARPLPAIDVAGLRPMTLESLNDVMLTEIAVYPFPWSRGNFIDSLAAGHLAWTLHETTGALIGYCVAMVGVDEMHLLNITVAAAERRRGHARQMLAGLVAACRERGLGMLWLEVRTSNHGGRATYARLGFGEVGMRKAYYPAPEGTREDAVVMSLPIAAAGSPGTRMGLESRGSPGQRDEGDGRAME